MGAPLGSAPGSAPRAQSAYQQAMPLIFFEKELSPA